MAGGTEMIPSIKYMYNPLSAEFPKWTHSTLNLGMTIVANRGVSTESKTKWQNL